MMEYSPLFKPASRRAALPRRASLIAVLVLAPLVSAGCASHVDFPDMYIVKLQLCDHQGVQLAPARVRYALVSGEPDAARLEPQDPRVGAALRNADCDTNGDCILALDLGRSCPVATGNLVRGEVPDCTRTRFLHPATVAWLYVEFETSAGIDHVTLPAKCESRATSGNAVVTVTDVERVGICGGHR